MVDGSARLDRCGTNLDGEVHAVRSWYVTLGDSLVNATPAPPPHIRDVEGRRRLLACVHDAVRGGVESELGPALVLLWAEQHLDNLWRLETHLPRAAAGTSPVGTAMLSRPCPRARSRRLRGGDAFPGARGCRGAVRPRAGRGPVRAPTRRRP